jgi:hypothetical protein
MVASYNEVTSCRIAKVTLSQTMGRDPTELSILHYGARIVLKKWIKSISNNLADNKASE